MINSLLFTCFVQITNVKLFEFAYAELAEQFQVQSKLVQRT